MSKNTTWRCIQCKQTPEWTWQLLFIPILGWFVLCLKLATEIKKQSKANPTLCTRCEKISKRAEYEHICTINALKDAREVRIIKERRKVARMYMVVHLDASVKEAMIAADRIATDLEDDRA